MRAAVKRAAKTRARAQQISTETAPRFYIDVAVDKLHEFEDSVDDAFFGDESPDPVMRRARIALAVQIWCATHGK
jgi:hypothetical protein